MAGRKLVRDLLLATRPRSLHLASQQASNGRLRLISVNGYSGNRLFSVFNEFSQKVQGEAKSNAEFQKSVKEFKEKAEELKGMKEELKVRTKQTTEQLYKRVDGVWSDAEATAKKVQETFGIGKQESSEYSGAASENGSGTSTQNGGKASFGAGEKEHNESGSTDTAETLFGKIKMGISSPKVFQRLREAKVIDIAKKGYDIVKDELSSTPSKRKHLEYTPSPSMGERSTRTDIVILPSQQSRLGKKWEAFKEKMQGHPLFKHISRFGEPVATKSQEIAEDMRERWETSDNPIVHKIQDINESIFHETDAATSFKEICRRDPSFSLPEFVAEVQEAIKPVLDAYMKGDVETLKKYCSPEVIERCRAEHNAYQSHGIFFDNKILHISDVEVRETKMMGTSPIIIVAFQTQQVHCVRDRGGAITEGGKDTIHTVYYAWAMQQVDVEELGELALYPIWKLREMQQIGVQALI
ncbi:hypothetical protein SLE2022_208210 [Rubroshorea leprosula]